MSINYNPIGYVAKATADFGDVPFLKHAHHLWMLHGLNMATIKHYLMLAGATEDQLDYVTIDFNDKSKPVVVNITEISELLHDAQKLIATHKQNDTFKHYFNVGDLVQSISPWGQNTPYQIIEKISDDEYKLISPLIPLGNPGFTNKPYVWPAISLIPFIDIHQMNLSTLIDLSDKPHLSFDNFSLRTWFNTVGDLLTNLSRNTQFKLDATNELHTMVFNKLKEYDIRVELYKPEYFQEMIMQSGLRFVTSHSFQNNPKPFGYGVNPNEHRDSDSINEPKIKF
jgi:hypothetical protein